MKNINKITEEFICAAVAHGDSTLKGDYKFANKQYATLTKIYKMIENDQKFAEIFLERIFRHENISVRIWSAAYALDLGLKINDAVRILQLVIEDSNAGILRLDAEYTLKKWKKTE